MIFWDLTEAGPARNRQEESRQAREAAIAFLGLAKKPSGRVRQKLLDKGFAPDLVEEQLHKLADDGYLDDLALARRTMQQRQGRQAESRHALAWRLGRAGLAPEAVQAAVEEAPADYELASGLWQNRFETNWQDLCTSTADPTEKKKFLAKAARFMAGRGFSAAVISRIIPFD